METPPAKNLKVPIVLPSQPIPVIIDSDLEYLPVTPYRNQDQKPSASAINPFDIPFDISQEQEKK